VIEGETVRLLRRDILLLCALGACVIAVYIIAKAAAARVGAIESRVAATWYRDGVRKFTSGDTEGAVDSFRKATAIDRENRTYVLAMADALAAANHNMEAQQALQQLREEDPTNAEVNLHLARLAAKRGNIPEAVLYYHSALDGMWAGPKAQEQRRNIRIELIQFLIARHDENRALSELLVLDTELPDKAAAHVQVAKLFAEAEDLRHALNDFTEALQLDPHDVDAMGGAGAVAFSLGDRHKARHFLEEAEAHGDKSAQTLQLLTQLRQGGAQ
jgi:Tfp pilus assembly protein PilF